MFKIMKPETKIVSVAAVPEPQTALLDLGGHPEHHDATEVERFAQGLEIVGHVASVRVSTGGAMSGRCRDGPRG
jgi:hypothetical protein